MKLSCFIEKIIDFGVLLALVIGITYWLSVFCAVPIALLTFLLLFKGIGRTPGMLLTSNSSLPTVKALFGFKRTKEKRSLMRTLLGAGMVLFCALGMAFTFTLRDFSMSYETHHKNTGWEYYISEDRGFSVQFPGSPSVETKQLYIADADKMLSYSEYKSIESSDTAYTVSYMDFPSKWRFVGAKRLLSTAFEQLVKNDRGTEILSQTMIQHKSYPALEFTLKKEKEEIRGRLILVGNTFYKITQVSSVSTSLDDSQFASFLSSFQFPK